ncbi:MAG TPA: 1,4-dihydroxy-6-naphthoate synthase [Spirochaetota bacterium]|nr:1,4-dihydroxy-6-naphthoate synthase [Spirochaetota bacterium]HSA16264.1 1,4-dihydroxy-6-naphthoate synthase [Spirochaetota bacterium]
MKSVDIAFSPCPNDTFIFHAMLHGLVDGRGYEFKPLIHDVETLNRLAFEGSTAVTKLSFYSYLLLKERYAMLSSGAALGHGCGPLLVARPGAKNTGRMSIAVPGMHTTAYLLLRLWFPDAADVTERPFDRIIAEVADGKFDAGLIIHEGRFVYMDSGLVRLVDLGEWWEAETGMPIPLGCIAMKRSCGEGMKTDVEGILRESVVYARANSGASRVFVKRYAQEMDDRVIDEHIGLYVNDYTVDLGEKGAAAIERLEGMALRAGLL